MRVGSLVTAASLLLLAAALSVHSTTTLVGQSASFANFEGSQTNPIRLSADRTRLFAVI